MNIVGKILWTFLIICTAMQFSFAQEQLRVQVIGAHPDDAEKCGGTAALYTAAGNTVQFVSLTNGDAGHQTQAGAFLANRRAKEAENSGKVIGVEYIILDNHDGELMPDLENRKKVIRIIREFQPDIIITHRPNDYHPDHRYTGRLVLDAAYMVMVPNIVENIPPLKKNPVIMFMSDGFTLPNKFEPDVVIAIDKVIDKKIEMYHCHTSQVYEWLPWINGNLDDVPKNENERRKWLAETWIRPYSKDIADKYRDLLIDLYGKEKGSKVKYAEAFQDSEYGSRLTKNNIKVLFPFFGTEK